MKHLYSLAISACITLLLFTAVIYVSCKKHNTCTTNSCQNNGACVDGQCKCPDGFTGPHCETNLCKDVVCRHGGTCGNGKCKCVPPFYGPYCQTEPCDSVTCYNGGHCMTGNCDCPKGTGGRYCETVFRDKFIGIYKGYYACPTLGSDTATLQIEPGPYAISSVIVHYRSANTTTDMQGTVYNKDSLSVSAPLQFIPAYSLDGTLVLNGNALQFYFTLNKINEPPYPEYCSGLYIKQ